MNEILKGKSILIVDDEENTIAPLRAWLRQKGATVKYVNQLDRAINELLESKNSHRLFDLVILDLRFTEDLPEQLRNYPPSPLQIGEKPISFQLYGLVLGSWIKENIKGQSYCFYTILPEKASAHTEKENTVIDKLATSIPQVVSTIESILESRLESEPALS